jgi:hypothetical protein
LSVSAGANFLTELIKWRSSTHANIVTIGSRTKTKQNAIKTHFTCGATLGHVRQFLHTKQPFTPQLQYYPQTSNLPLQTPVAFVGKNFRITPNQIGIGGSSISPMFTSLGSVIKPRNFTEPTTSDSI